MNSRCWVSFRNKAEAERSILSNVEAELNEANARAELRRFLDTRKPSVLISTSTFCNAEPNSRIYEAFLALLERRKC